MCLDLTVILELLQTNIANKVGNVKKVRKNVEFWTKEKFEKVISHLMLLIIMNNMLSL